MFLFFPAFGLLALAPGSYFSVQDEPSAYDANFLAGIRFVVRERKIPAIGTTVSVGTRSKSFRHQQRATEIRTRKYDRGKGHEKHLF